LFSKPVNNGRRRTARTTTFRAAQHLLLAHLSTTSLPTSPVVRSESLRFPGTEETSIHGTQMSAMHERSIIPATRRCRRAALPNSLTAIRTAPDRLLAISRWLAANNQCSARPNNVSRTARVYRGIAEVPQCAVYQALERSGPIRVEIAARSADSALTFLHRSEVIATMRQGWPIHGSNERSSKSHRSS
jgi:hypothetical protein